MLDAGVLYLVTRSVLLDATTSVAESAATVLARELTATPKADWDRVLAVNVKGTALSKVRNALLTRLLVP